MGVVARVLEIHMWLWTELVPELAKEGEGGSGVLQVHGGGGGGRPSPLPRLRAPLGPPWDPPPPLASDYAPRLPPRLGAAAILASISAGNNLLFDSGVHDEPGLRNFSVVHGNVVRRVRRLLLSGDYGVSEAWPAGILGAAFRYDDSVSLSPVVSWFSSCTYCVLSDPIRLSPWSSLPLPS